MSDSLASNYNVPQKVSARNREENVHFSGDVFLYGIIPKHGVMRESSNTVVLFYQLSRHFEINVSNVLGSTPGNLAIPECLE